jgi:hypothetical protein
MRLLRYAHNDIAGTFYETINIQFSLETVSAIEPEMGYFLLSFLP